MKKVTKFFLAALLAGICSLGYAQDYLKAPKANEKIIGQVSVSGLPGWRNAHAMYEALLDKAKQEYPSFKVVDIRTMNLTHMCSSCSGESVYDAANGTVVDAFESKLAENLSQSINKALRNVREGSRMAIDQVSVPYSMDRETLKDQLIDVLLDNGYKVVAKEYLEKLYEEQQGQQSGIYNERTTVQENNFSAVGYYINVKVTETSLRVQVVNVSTGEYEGNATVNF